MYSYKTSLCREHFFLPFLSQFISLIFSFLLQFFSAALGICGRAKIANLLSSKLLQYISLFFRTPWNVRQSFICGSLLRYTPVNTGLCDGRNRYNKFFALSYCWNTSFVVACVYTIKYFISIPPATFRQNVSSSTHTFSHKNLMCYEAASAGKK